MRKYLGLLIVLLLVLTSCNAVDSVISPTTTSSKTGLTLSSAYQSTYPAYEKSLSSGETITSKVPMPPPIKVWNYAVSYRPGIIVYAVRVEKSSEGVTMIGFWQLNNGSWEFSDNKLLLSYKIFPNIQIDSAPAFEIR